MKKVAFSKNKTWLIDRGSRTKMKKALKKQMYETNAFLCLKFYGLNERD